MVDRPKGSTVGRTMRQREPVSNPKPYDKENKHLSKEQYVAKNNKRKEKEAKLKAYAEELDKDQAAVPEPEAPVAEPKPKKSKKKE